MSIYVNQQPQFCIYLTIYSGNKLPPFYIGSTSIVKIKNDYHGSVSSKKYKNIWKQELKENPHLFKTIILYTFYSRKNATYHEYLLQKQFNVVKSNQFINMAFANKKFGMDISGENHPMWNRQQTIESRIKMSKSGAGKILTESWKRNISISGTGIKKPGTKRPNRTGNGHERSIPITIDGITYPSRRQAKIILNIPQSVIKKYITK